MDTSGYVFVLTLIDPKIDIPYEVIPNHVLKKADQAQIDKIKSLLQRFNTNPFFISISHYEHDILAVLGNKPGNISYKHNALATDEWHYWIIQVQGTNSELQELSYALALMENDIELGFFVISTGTLGDGFVWHSQHLHTFFNDYELQASSPKEITDVDLKLAEDCYSKLKSIPKEYPHIKRAFQLFDMLRCIPATSELTVIGLFSIIESLLTHAPNDKDPTDSLVRQIKHKIPLVRKRHRRRIDYKTIFNNNIKEDKLWEKLYAYRSKIVHGESVKLSNKLRVLKNQKTIVKFLREMVKLLLIGSLDEPKEC